MDVPASVLFSKRLVESRVRSIARNDEWRLLMDGFNQFERKVRNTLTARRRTDNEELEVGVIALGSDTVLEIEIRHRTSASGERSE